MPVSQGVHHRHLHRPPSVWAPSLLEPLQHVDVAVAGGRRVRVRAPRHSFRPQVVEDDHVSPLDGGLTHGLVHRAPLLLCPPQKTEASHVARRGGPSPSLCFQAAGPPFAHQPRRHVKAERDEGEDVPHHVVMQEGDHRCCRLSYFGATRATHWTAACGVCKVFFGAPFTLTRYRTPPPPSLNTPRNVKAANCDARRGKAVHKERRCLFFSVSLPSNSPSLTHPGS